MISVKIFTLVSLSALVAFADAVPDSAGIVEMVNGLAYGGIPYGSVTGMVAKYPNDPQGRGYQYNSVAPVAGIRTSPTIVITPNVRAPGLEARGHGPVQIYNHPGVVAPGVVGTISQIGY